MRQVCTRFFDPVFVCLFGKIPFSDCESSDRASQTDNLSSEAYSFLEKFILRPIEVKEKLVNRVVLF